MKNRTELAKHFAELGFSKGAEIGVYAGYYSRVLLDIIPDLQLASVDSWKRRPGKDQARAYEQAAETLNRYAGSTIIRGNSVDVAKTIGDDSLDFVFIDAAHDYENVKADIEAWYPKVRSGGIVSGHDYYEGMTLMKVQVIQAIDEFIEKHNLDLNVTEWDKSNAIKDDRQPCWYFTKP